MRKTKKTYIVAALNFFLAVAALIEINSIKSSLEEIKDSYNRTGKKLTF